MQVDIYVPVGGGVKASRLIADFLEAAYDSLDLAHAGGLIYFRTPSSREISGNEVRASNLEDNWGRYVVECPYDTQSVVSA